MFLDDVIGAKLSDLKMVQANDNPVVIKLKNSSDVIADNIVYFKDQWDKSPTKLPSFKQSGMSSSGFPKL
ncbi:hypothetical protein D3C85_1930970 [compost metagenome]